MTIARWYRKNNGMRRVYLIGYHPMKDFVCVTAGENDCVFLSFEHFQHNYTEEI